MECKLGFGVSSCTTNFRLPSILHSSFPIVLILFSNCFILAFVPSTSFCRLLIELDSVSLIFPVSTIKKKNHFI